MPKKTYEIDEKTNTLDHETLAELQTPLYPQDFLHIMQDYGYTKINDLLVEEIGGERGKLAARLLDHLSMCYTWEAMIIHNGGKLPGYQNTEMLLSLPEMLRILAQLGTSWHSPSSWFPGGEEAGEPIEQEAQS